MISPGDRWWRYDSSNGQTPPRRGTGEDSDQVDERQGGAETAALVTGKVGLARLLSAGAPDSRRAAACEQRQPAHASESRPPRCRPPSYVRCAR